MAEDNARRYWWLGILIGLAVGVAIALILAPDSGKRVRQQLLRRVDRLRGEVRGTERFGGGVSADPITALKRRVGEAREAAQRAYLLRRAELEAELEAARKPQDALSN